MIVAGYASPHLAISELLDLVLPRTRQTVSQFAIRNRRLNNAGGGYVGVWSHDLAPYLVEPMDCLTSMANMTVAVVGPGQCGKTEIAQNWLLRSVAADPADTLWYMQTDDSLEAFVKQRINPMIDAHQAMSSRLGRRSSDDSLHFKGFRGMRAEFLSATESNLINKSAPRIVADEIDAWPKSLGDAKALLDVRRQTFGRQSKILALSHCDRARGLDAARDWTDGILAIYADSDRRVWYWQCPHCGAWSSPAPTADRVMTIDYPPDGTLDEIEAEARLVCPVAGCLIEDSYRRDMNRYGRWIGEGQDISEDGIVTGELVPHLTAGFWIVGAMSPFIIGGIGGLARARAKAERECEASGEDASIRTVMVKQWGLPYVARKQEGTVDANVLADRAVPHLKLGVVPEGVRFLTAVADVQGKYFDCLVRGWGVGGESWVIDKLRIDGHPDTAPEDWDKLYDQLYAKSYPLADGSGRFMRIRAGGYDSGGLPGVTQQAYSAWLRWRARRRITLLGQISKRDVWTIMPMKGGNKLGANRLMVSYPDTARQANARAAAGSVPLLLFNPNLFKDDLSGQLKRAEPGDWYVHFPADLKFNADGRVPSEGGPHVWFEQLVAEKQRADGRWEKPHSSVRNEAMDLMVMSHVLARLWGVMRIPWDQPPPWAAPWSSNSMIETAAAKGARLAPPVAAAPVSVSHAKEEAASGPLFLTERGWVKPGSAAPAPQPAPRSAAKSLINRLA